MFILNAFSINMLAIDNANVSFNLIDLDTAKQIVKDCDSGVGHTETANVFSTILEHNVPVNRVNVKLSIGDTCLVGQYIGDRLPEGATQLPEGATIKWFKVTINN